MIRRKPNGPILAVLLCSLVLALLACSTQTARSNIPAGGEKQPADNPPTVAFCDLVGDPGRYDGKVVRTQAIISVGFEVAIVYDPKCGDREKRAWYDFDQSTYEPEEKGWKALRNLLFSKEGKGRSRNRARTMMVGRLNGSNQNGYGHLNQYHYQFTIMHIDKAEAVADDVPD